MRYVAVSTDENDKTIKDGPFELDDPSQRTVQEGQRLMPEDAALAAGYHYASDGAFAPDHPAADEDEQGDQNQQ
ncbi:hypothetical protein [Streptomyces sp. NPDC088789]|uniref:hypothetical protein n=1 Tax=Streptomyces sp. NPDC088789 TaxID=3365899 RepID=UPI00380E3DCA